MKEKHWSRSNVEVVQSQVKQKRVQKSQHLLNIGKKNWSYGAPNPPVPKASWWDPILGSHEAATCRQVHCQSPRSCRTCVGPHRKLQEIEGVLVDLGGANQHFVLLQLFFWTTQFDFSWSVEALASIPSIPGIMYFLPVSRCAFDWNLRFVVLSNLNMNHMNLYLAFYVHELAGRPCFQQNLALATLHPNNNLHVAYTSDI